MIATIIPYFLLASVPNASWEYGPEYHFAVNITVKEKNDNNQLNQGVNVTNELICRPKEINVLSCAFRHLKFDFYNQNSSTGEMSQIHSNPDLTVNHHEGSHHEGHDPEHIYNKINFELNLGKKGVESIVLSEDATKDVRLNIVKSVGNLFNVATDLSTKNTAQKSLNISDEPTSEEETVNFLFAGCKVHVTVGYLPGENNSAVTNKKDFQLELVDSLKDVSGKKFMLNKSLYSSNCSDPISFYWSELLFRDIKKDPNLELLILRDALIVQKREFRHKFRLFMRTNKAGQDFTITESINVHLDDIKPAQGEVTQIKNPTTVTFNKQS